MTAALPTPEWREDEISKLPALQLLVNLGWEYLPPAEVLRLRGGRRGRVVLGEVLAAKLRELNAGAVRHKGETHAFTEENIQTAVRAMEDVVPHDGLVRANERAYNLLRLGRSLPQNVRGDVRSFDVRYVEWDPRHVARNAFHVTEEFAVDATAKDASRPDIVCFVNGIPLVVIECKRPSLKAPMQDAIEQQIRNQKDDYIPRLFVYAQLLLALSTNEARYATVGTPAKFWASWREERLDETALAELVNRPLPPAAADALLAGRHHDVRRYVEALAASGRAVTEQDRALWSLARPERVLELTRRFVVFDAGEKKIARHQQYESVRRTLARVLHPGPDGTRPGGVVWHTQGSGKSLTMVMLAAALFDEVKSPARKVVLVTDRTDLDKQIWGVFAAGGHEPQRARTGRHLAELLGDDKAEVITTVIDKFDAVTRLGLRFDSPDVFVLVDESHRGQYGAMHGRMKKALPRACFLGFTGTPVVRAEKNTIARFGGLIHSYTIDQAVRDQAVVRLLYEGRDVPALVDREQVDRWFERITGRLTPEQAADLKRKFSSAAQLNQVDQRITTIAWDVSAHFAKGFQGSGAKGQLVAPSKVAALRYKAALDEAGLVSSEVLMSAPDDREGDDDLYAENRSQVVTFWRAMMQKYGTEKEYNEQLIAAFKGPGDPEILIVVDKLLTGFDSPRNTVLYLTRPLKEHTLLQAIARVNRVFAGKDFGYVVDYAGVLRQLGEALDLYGSLAGFDPLDLEGTLTDVSDEVAKVPQRHSDVWALFGAVRNRLDQEEYERLLADDALRDDFSRALSAYGRTLAVALGSVRFLEQTPEATVEKYTHDLRFFEALRRSVRRRYAESVDYGEYEPKIQRLLDRHVGAGVVEAITPLVDVFDKEAFAREVERAGTPGAKADTIAHRLKRTITERMDDDPAFYRPFSQLLDATIAEWRARRLAESGYLERMQTYAERIVSRQADEVPPGVRYSPEARAIYSAVRERLATYGGDRPDLDAIGAQTAAAMDRAIEARRVVNWGQNVDVQNRMRNDIEDELFALRDRHEIPLTLDEIDHTMDEVLDIARQHKPS